MKASERKILVPVDTSKESMYGVMTAIELAKMGDSSIVLFHVISDINQTALRSTAALSATPAIDMATSQQIKKVKSEIEEELRTLKRNLGIFNVVIETEVVVGQFGDELVKTTELLKPDLIILGTNGEKSFEQHIFGSHSEQSVHLSGTPVLVVKNFQSPFRLQSMLLGVDLEEYSPEAVAAIRKFAEVLGLKVHLVYVMNDKNAIAVEVFARLNLFAQANNFENYTVNIAGKGNVYDKLISYAKKNDIDILATISRANNGLIRLILGSDTDNVIEKAERPVLAVQD